MGDRLGIRDAVGIIFIFLTVARHAGVPTKTAVAMPCVLKVFVRKIHLSCASCAERLQVSKSRVGTGRVSFRATGNGGSGNV